MHGYGAQMGIRPEEPAHPDPNAPMDPHPNVDPIHPGEEPVPEPEPRHGNPA